MLAVVLGYADIRLDGLRKKLRQFFNGGGARKMLAFISFSHFFEWISFLVLFDERNGIFLVSC